MYLSIHLFLSIIYLNNTNFILRISLQSDAQGYDPKRSRVNDDTMADFIRSTVTGDVTEVPGIGPAAAKKLACGEGDEKVTNTYQLIGKFLMLKGPDEDDNKVESMEHCEKFWYWLQDKGISAHRSAIVKAVACKVNGLLPGVYDPDLYDDDDE
jgi:hypothetical protein